MAIDRLRVGIIGAGWAAFTTHIPALRATGRAEVVAICRRSPERLALLQRATDVPEMYTDWQEMIEHAGLDAVVVSTPHDTHLEPVLVALQKGLHVLLEKPSAHATADAWKIARATERATGTLVVGHDVRGMRSWRAVKKVIDAGQVGQLKQVSAVCALDWLHPGDRRQLAEPLQQLVSSSEVIGALAGDMTAETTWRRDSRRMGGDMLMDSGIHLVDLMLWLGGAAPQRVAAFRTADEASGILTLQAQLTNGVLLSLTFNDAVTGERFGFYGQGQLTAIGNKAQIQTSWRGPMKAEAEFVTVEGPSGQMPIAFGDLEESVLPATSFVATVLDGAPVLCTAHDGANAVTLVQAAYESATTGQIVRLDPKTWSHA